MLEISRESIDASTIPGIVSNRAADLGFHEDSDSDGFVFVRTETRITPSTDPIPVVKRLEVAMTFREDNLKYKIDDGQPLEYKIKLTRFFD